MAARALQVAHASAVLIVPVDGASRRRIIYTWANRRGGDARRRCRASADHRDVNSMPAISFLMAAFKRSRFAMAALESLKAQTMPDWELIVAPDDGEDYRDLAHADARVKVAHSSAVRTGPAHARNRALEIACGELIAVLDDDDCVEPAFVAQALAYFKSHPTNFVTVPTEYFNHQTGAVVRQIGQFPAMGIDRFGLEFGTMHAIGRRCVYPEWKPGFAEDVMHTCKCIDLAGGEITVLPDANYRLRLHPDSLCATSDGPSISQSYRNLKANLPYDMSNAGARLTRELLQRRIRMNEAFWGQAGDRGYHEFVKRHGQAWREPAQNAEAHVSVWHLGNSSAC
ncbi:MAG: glycosyltransferase family 2 protein [Candidimonas sp.]|nr:MAG: glycosyltransferase family 2 protein [Candidimonas sp.]